jgi:2-amino-4-hydroxy-6-hydroxymethyldihydropteridine diphosphokinase
MEEVGIGIGSNLGNRLQLLAEAIVLIGELPLENIRVSTLVESAAWGYQSSNTYYNGVLVGQTTLQPEELLSSLLDIERHLGRTRVGKSYSDRVIDLDILFYGNQIAQEERLILPHPRMHLRRFVLEPLQEIAPHWVHPQLGESVEELLKSCVDAPLLGKVVLH